MARGSRARPGPRELSGRSTCSRLGPGPGPEEGPSRPLAPKSSFLDGRILSCFCAGKVPGSAQLHPPTWPVKRFSGGRRCERVSSDKEAPWAG